MKQGTAPLPWVLVVVGLVAASARPSGALPNDAIGHAAAALGAGPVTPRVASALTEPTVPPPDLARLRAVEQGWLLRETRDAGVGVEARHTELLGYYRDANPELFGHLDRIRDRDPSRRGLTFLRIAPDAARVYLWTRLLPDATQLPALTRERRESLGVGAPALRLGTTQGDLVIERTFSLPNVQEVFDAAPEGSRTWLVTSLEGLADETLERALAVLLERVCSGRVDHVVVLGMPETLPAGSGSHCADRSVSLFDFTLQHPSFRSEGDLRLWIDEHAGVRDRRYPAEAALGYLARYPWLRASFGTFSVAESVLRLLPSPPKGGLTQAMLEDAVVNGLITRYADLYARPKAPPSLIPYRGALAAIAAHYATRVGPDGTFAVGPTDLVRPRRVQAPDLHLPLGSEALRRSVTPLGALLRHSRIVRFVSATPGVTRYRFEPSWTQRVLARSTERHLFVVEAP